MVQKSDVRPPQTNKQSQCVCLICTDIAWLEVHQRTARSALSLCAQAVLDFGAGYSRPSEAGRD